MRGFRARRSLPWLIAGLSSIGPFSIDTYLPSFPAIASALSTNEVAVQQTLTAYLVPFAMMILWHGAISDAVGRRVVVLISLSLFMVASIGCALSPTIEWLWFFRALQGIVAGAGMVVGRAVVRDVYEGADAQRVMSYITVIFAIAPAIAPVIGGWLQAGLGWRAVFGFMSLISGSLAIWAWFSLPETLPKEQRRPFQFAYLAGAYRKVLSTPAFLGAGGAVGFNFAALFLYVTSAPVFLPSQLGISETGFFWLFGPMTAGMISGSLLSARLAGRLSRLHTIAVGGGIMAVATLWNVLINSAGQPGLPWAVLPLYVYATGMALAMPSLTLCGLDLFPTQKGLAASCQGFLMTVTNTLIAGVFAPMVHRSGLLLALGAALLFCLGLVATALYRRAAPPPD